MDTLQTLGSIADIVAVVIALIALLRVEGLRATLKKTKVIKGTQTVKGDNNKVAGGDMTNVR